jgi:hypothetical protein
MLSLCVVTAMLAVQPDITGTLFLQYLYEHTEAAERFNAFDVTRAYFGARVEPHEHVRLRLTVDAPAREAVTKVDGGVTTVTPEAGRRDVVLKHAYAELHDLPLVGLALRLGMQDLPWVPMQEKLWTYRFQGTVFADREGYASSTDLGAGLAYGGAFGDVALAVVNGETWSKPEVSRHKDVQARLTWRPLADHELWRGFAVSAGGSFGQYDIGPDAERRRLHAAMAFEHPWASVGVEYLRAEDPPAKIAPRQPAVATSTASMVTAQGWSAWGWIDVGIFGVASGVRLMGRVDWLDPNLQSDANAHRRYIAGVGFRAAKDLQVLLDAEHVEHGAAGVGTEDRAAVHALIGF